MLRRCFGERGSIHDEAVKPVAENEAAEVAHEIDHVSVSHTEHENSASQAEHDPVQIGESHYVEAQVDVE